MTPAVWVKTCTCKRESLVRSKASDWISPESDLELIWGWICETRQNARASGHAKMTPAVRAKT